MPTTIDKPVQVLAWCDGRTGKMVPKLVRWEGNDYLVKEIGFRHPFREGRDFVHVFTVNVALKDGPEVLARAAGHAAVPLLRQPDLEADRNERCRLPLTKPSRTLYINAVLNVTSVIGGDVVNRQGADVPRPHHGNGASGRKPAYPKPG